MLLRWGKIEMAEVTGPISSLPGTSHDFPDGTKCDLHQDRPAIARIQGETDSMGCEMNDMCTECLEEFRAYLKSPEGQSERHGRCDWCKKQATDLRDARDYEEGMNGPVYRVCAACVKARDDEVREELERYGVYDDFDDDFEEVAP